MGGSTSKDKEPDVEESAEDKKAKQVKKLKEGLSKVLPGDTTPGAELVPAQLTEALNYATEGILNLGSVMAMLEERVEAELMKHLTPEEKKKFNVLEAKKLEVLDDVQEYTGMLKIRLEEMVHEVDEYVNKPGKYVDTLLRNIDTSASIETNNKLTKQLDDVRLEYKTFAESLTKDAENDGRIKDLEGRARRKKLREKLLWIAGLVCAAGAIAFSIYLVIQTGGVAGVYLTGFGKFMLGATGTVAVASGVVYTTALFHQDEIDYMNIYLQAVIDGLEEIRKPLQDLKNHEKTMLKDQKTADAFKRMANQVIAKCETIDIVVGKIRKLHNKIQV